MFETDYVNTGGVNFKVILVGHVLKFIKYIYEVGFPSDM